MKAMFRYGMVEVVEGKYDPPIRMSFGFIRFFVMTITFISTVA